MRKELYKKIEIPQGIEAEVEGNMLKVKGSEGEISKKFNIKNLEFGIKDGKIIVGNKKSTKKEKKMMNTVAAHIKNMIRGVQGKFEYELVAVGELLCVGESGV